MNGASERHRQEARGRQSRINARKRTGRKSNPVEDVYYERGATLRYCPNCSGRMFVRKCSRCGYYS